MCASMTASCSSDQMGAIHGCAQFLTRAAGPADFQADGSLVRAQAEVQRQVVLVALAGGTLDLAREGLLVEAQPDLRRLGFGDRCLSMV